VGPAVEGWFGTVVNGWLGMPTMWAARAVCWLAVLPCSPVRDRL